MEFFSSAVTILQTLVVAIGAGLGVWGGVNLLEGYGSENPGSQSQGRKHLMGQEVLQKKKRKTKIRRGGRKAVGRNQICKEV